MSSNWSRIYLWSDEEKQQKKPLGHIELRTPHNHNQWKKVIIAEWVNADEWATILREKTSIQVLKILFNLSPETSLIRVLRRDHERKGYSFASILKHRLKEYYLIMKRYIEPALQDPDTIILNKRRELPPFTKEEISTIYVALNQLQESFAQDDSLTEEHRAFISTLIQELQKIFGKMRWVSDNELEIWRLEKILKKEQEQLLILKWAYHQQELVVQSLKERIWRI